MAWTIPFFAGRSGFRPGRMVYLFVMGSTAGLAAWAAVAVIGYQIGELAGGAFLIVLLISPGARKLKASRQILMDAAPLLIMAFGIVVVNSAPLLRELAGQKWSFGLSVIPGRAIVFRPLSDAYIYLFIAFVIAHRLHGKGRSIAATLVKGTRQGWRAVLSMALFGGMGQVLSFTGWDLVSGQAINQAGNIPRIVAGSLLSAGPVYPVLVPFLGWVGTFLTGYGVASIMLFASLQMTIAGKLGVSPESLVCGLAVGASIGGISSPFKVAFAASMCGAAGQEGDILRKTIPLGIGACIILGMFMLLV
jgi:lactate permease